MKAIFRNISSLMGQVNSCLEIRFTNTAGYLYAKNAIQAEFSIHAENWSHYNENNDYSSYLEPVNYSDWERITVYHKGRLISGFEPL